LCAGREKRSTIPEPEKSETEFPLPYPANLKRKSANPKGENVIRKLVFLLAIVAIVSGATIVSQAQPQNPVTRHTRDEVVTGRVPLVGHLPANQTMDITFILQQRNQEERDQLLKDLYDRTSPSFRQFLTVEQFTEKFGPSREDYETVKAFARANGFQILSTSRNRMNLRVRGTVETIERALNLKMNVYQHPTEARTFFAPDREPSLDMPVRLWAVGSMDTYSTPHPMVTKRDLNAAQPEGVISNATTGSCPGASFCGSDMRAAYYGGTALTGAGQSVGLFEFLGTDLTDLTAYYTGAGQTQNVPVTLTSVDTQSTLCKEPSCDDTEQTLDMTQAMGMAPNMSGLTMWIGTGGLSGQTLDDPGILNGMVTASPLQAQLSCSWEWKPADNTTDDPYFITMAMQGQNFFVAAGDDGNWAHASFVWPADDVNIVSVGGTDLETSSAGGPWSSETGWVDGGGGITKNGFAIPSWQVTAAAGCAKCSQTLRNGPDVSANSNFTFYVCADQTTCSENLYGGTSFATPMWAGFLALVNEQAVANGQPLLGFVNPALYAAYSSSSYDSDFHDILTGGNTLGATVGYDLATGIGSPQAALIDVLAPAPVGSFTLAAKPAKATIAPGGHGNVKVTATPSGGFNAAISLSASGEPTGVKIAFKPGSIAGGSGTAAMQVNVTSKAAAGTYTITITGVGGSVTETTTFTLTIS
jgi:subtilase family serine protease